MTENIDSLVSTYIRQWLGLSISATLTSIVQSNNEFGLNLQLPFVKFARYRTVCYTALRSSANNDIHSYWKITSNGMNLQYDIYRCTKEVLKRKTRFTYYATCHPKVLSFLFYWSILFQSPIQYGWRHKVTFPLTSLIL